MEQLSADGRPAISVLTLPRLMSRATTAALHEALDTYGSSGLMDSRLRPAARMVCDDARASGFRVEQMLIALKHEWAALLEHHQIPYGDARYDLTSRFITLCIHAFYAGEPSPRDVGDVRSDETKRSMRS